MAIRRILAIIIALSLVLGMLVCLSGCSSSEREEYYELTEREYGCLIPISIQKQDAEGYYYTQFIFYDPDTLVMYVYIYDSEGTSMSVLYNADGTPKLYNPEK